MYEIGTIYIMYNKHKVRIHGAYSGSHVNVQVLTGPDMGRILKAPKDSLKKEK
jgi:hypothetical protein